MFQGFVRGKVFRVSKDRVCYAGFIGTVELYLMVGLMYWPIHAQSHLS